MEINDDDDILDFSTKCTICNNMLRGNEILKHECFSNAKHVFINETGDLVPQFETDTSSIASSTPTTSSSISALTLASTSASTSHCTLEGTTATQREDIEELLIAEVQKRRELWDHTLPISTRSREVIASHWEAISKQLNGILTPFIASKKWRYLRDSYMRIRNEQLKKRSGSAAPKPIKWKWYNYMQFLNDTQDFRSTTSNVSSNEINESDVEDTRSTCKRRKKDNIYETISALVKEPINVNVTSANIQSEPKKISDKDNINNILAIINNILHEMPENEGFNFGLKLLHLTNEKENEFRNK